uniref:Uncharacterized protein n=1 Tax=Parastrongyloides trichosuri TaxID=131310 RepID=A0A0N5A2Q1_PARTI
MSRERESKTFSSLNQRITNPLNNDNTNRNLPRYSKNSEQIYDSPPPEYSQPHVPPTKEPTFTTKSVWTATTVPTASAGDSPVGAVPARANLYGKKPITGYISGHPSTPPTESQKSVNSSKNNQRIKSLFKEYESETNRIGEVTQSCKNPQSTNIKEWKEIKYASGDNRTTTEQRTTNLLNITKTSGPNPSLDTKTCQCPTGERNTNEASDTLKSLPSALSDTSSSSGDDLPDPTNATTTKSNIPGQLSTECTSKFYFSREDESKEPGRRNCIFKNTSTRQEEARIDDREPLSGWWKRDMLPKRESCKPERSINSLIGIFEQSIGFPLPSTFKNNSTNVSATNKTNEQSATTSISRTNEKEWDDKDGPTRDTISTTKTRWNDIWKQKAAPKRVLRDSIPTKLSTIYLEENNREEEEIIVKLK